jgi:FixJ family two-component response regulator
MMPGMSGSELAVQARESRPDLKVLLMSGYGEETIAQVDGKAGGFDLVEKPFTRAELIAAVSNTLDNTDPAGVTG